jgi:hypothetical protein
MGSFSTTGILKVASVAVETFLLRPRWMYCEAGCRAATLSEGSARRAACRESEDETRVAVLETNMMMKSDESLNKGAVTSNRDEAEYISVSER